MAVGDKNAELRKKKNWRAFLVVLAILMGILVLVGIVGGRLLTIDGMLWIAGLIGSIIGLTRVNAEIRALER